MSRIVLADVRTPAFCVIVASWLSLGGALATAQTLQFAAVASGAAHPSQGHLFVLGEVCDAITADGGVAVDSGVVPILFSPLLTGDMNCDGSLDFFDIDPFLLALFDPPGYSAAFPNCDLAAADVNGDGSVDFFDIDPFLTCLFAGPC